MSKLSEGLRKGDRGCTPYLECKINVTVGFSVVQIDAERILHGGQVKIPFEVRGWCGIVALAHKVSEMSSVKSDRTAYRMSDVVYASATIVIVRALDVVTWIGATH